MKDANSDSVSDRILIVQLSANRDGSAVSALMLADGLREQGWETHVAFGFAGPVISTFREHLHNVHVVPHKSWLRSGHCLRFMKYTLDELRAANGFTALIDELRPSLVYVNTAVSLAGVVAARRRNVPCVWHLREMFDDVGGEMRAPAGLKQIARSVLGRGADRLVANSSATAENMLNGNARKRAEVVPNAVSESFFSSTTNQAVAREAAGLPKTGRIIGVPGTLRPMKGHPFFFRAIKPVLQAESDLTVAVTGAGSPAYAEGLRTLVSNLRISDRVRFLGSIKEMPQFYRACDIVCVPSVAEPFGRTVIEAFASGTPVVATAVGGITEIVEHDITGLLVPYGDAQGLGEQIRRLLHDPALGERLRVQARARAEEAYHESVYKATICRIVSEVSGRMPVAAALRADSAQVLT